MSYLQQLKLLLATFSLILLSLFIHNTCYSQVNVLNELVNIYHKDTDLGIQNFRITSSHTSDRSGLTHYYLIQTHEGIDIYNAQSSVHMNVEGKVLHSTDRSIANANAAKKSLAIGPEEALAIVAAHFKMPVKKKTNVISSEPTKNRFHQLENESISQIPIQSNVIYYPENGTLKLGWQIVFEKADDFWWWDVIVDSSTGEILNKTSYTTSCSFDHDHSCIAEGHQHGMHKNAHDITTNKNHHHLNNEDQLKNVNQTQIINSKNTSSFMSASYNVYAMPLESPAEGARSIVTDPWLDALNASPQGWHDFNGTDLTITFGNNVRASTDLDNNNGPDQPLPDGGASFMFDFPIDLSMDPLTYTDASITNLFYWNNILHDVMYQYGFDEPSGNFQFSNYGTASGLEGDFVNADALDGSGTDNANFSSPPDGNGVTSRPRMQMFRWSAPGSTIAEINSPSSIAGNIDALKASFGPQDGTFTGDIVLVDDGGANNLPSEGCDPLVNGASISGNIALIDRGSCDFDQKAGNAESEGAIAAIICNNDGSPIIGPGGDGSPVVNIPTVMISQEDCAIIKANLPGVNITLTLSSTGTDFDSDLDNVIIAHEYGHGVSIRLVGGFATNCLVGSEQQGERWSDYLGLWLTMKPSDFADEPRAIGTYVQGEGAGDAGGSGIRPFLYTRDMSINPATYNDIAGVSIPHGVGTVWCVMLWDMTWNLVDAYGFDTDFYSGTGGNNVALALVIEGLKLTPCNPGFVDARDAILAADQALYGGANECLIWDAFARRGLGVGASQGNPNDVTDGVESFAVPNTCSTPGCTDPAAENYMASATMDDGSCTYCSDGVMNGDETGVDCGGSDPSCPPCSTCMDGIMNGNETDVDCGGPDCPACPTCSDGIMNGSEVGVDCGGPDCGTCPTCTDGMMNGDESGVDCGGSMCPTCPCTDVTLMYPSPSIIPNGTNKWVDQFIFIDGGMSPVTIQSGSVVNLRAGQYIEVQPQFEILQGAEVLLDIDPCN